MKKHLQPLLYTGPADITVNNVPVRIKEVTVTAFGAKLAYEVKQAGPNRQQLEAIHLTGVWTKDGKFVEGAGVGDCKVFDALEGVANASGLVSNSHPSPIDPAGVTAVSLGDIRIDLGKLTLQEGEPAILILDGTSATSQEKTGSAEAEKAAAQSRAERELTEAKKIAYQELKAASKEIQAKILEARKLIISSTSWVADGHDAYTTDADGNRIPVPHFSELFPGWELPAG